MNIPFVDIHTHKHYTDGTVSLPSYAIGKDKMPGTGVFSAGVHPYAAEALEIAEAAEYLQNAPVAAIGEIGLDYAVEVDKAAQERVFRMQLAIAEERKLPVVIHCVRAYNEVLSVLKDYVLAAVIFHGYTGSPQQTAIILGRGYYLSFGQRLSKSPKTVESIRITPADRLFAETDDDQVSIEAIYGEISEIVAIGIDHLKQIIYDNYKRIFR